MTTPFRELFDRLSASAEGHQAPSDQASFYRERREAALDALERLGVPTRRHEDWRYTPLGELGETIWHPASPAASAAPRDAVLEDWEDINRLVFVNGVYDAAASNVPDEKSLRVETLQAAKAKDPDDLATWFDDLARTDSMAFSAMNSAFYQDGVCIRVPAGKRVLRPVLILDLTDGLAEEEVIYPRHLLIAETGSDLRVVHIPRGARSGEAFRAISLVEAFVEPDARIRYDIMQDGDEQFHHVHNVEVRLAKNARFDARCYALGGALVRNDLNVRFAGEHAEADLRGFYLAQGKDVVDHHLILDHAVPNCLSNQLFKGIADDEGNAVFNGKVFVRKDAQKTNAYQTNKNLLLASTATVNTKPQLEIFADDVKCSHGATCGQLNEEAVFYLQARGLPIAEARTLLLRAFAAEAMADRDNDAFLALVGERLDSRLG